MRAFFTHFQHRHPPRECANCLYKILARRSLRGLRVRDLVSAAAHSKKFTSSLFGVNLGGLSVFGSTPGFVLYPRGGVST